MKKLMMMIVLTGMMLVQGCDDYVADKIAQDIADLEAIETKEAAKERRAKDEAKIAKRRLDYVNVVPIVAPEKDRTDDAWCIAQQFIEARLKSPRSAKWKWGGHTDRTINLGDGRYRYAYYVDSQNGFGAMIRTRFVCIVKWVGGTQWRLESLNFLE